MLLGFIVEEVMAYDSLMRLLGGLAGVKNDMGQKEIEKRMLVLEKARGRSS